MNILVAPDKFKGSLTAVQVCEAIETGIRRHDPEAVVMMHPLADGGEGTLDVLDAAMQLETEYLVVNDPLFRPIKAFYKRNRDTAFIEMAVASGLEILETAERNCLNTSTLGTGELMLHAISNGISTIYLFIGGSATNDAGIGMATALGYAFLDKNGRKVLPVGKYLPDIHSIDASHLYFKPDSLQVFVVCDVKNVLFGPEGAAHVYAPQKGADEAAVQLLDLGLRQVSRVIESHFLLNLAEMPGGGAAGGLGAGAVAFLNAQILPGVETIIGVSGVENLLARADLVITGEGKIDNQTLQGKVVKGVCEAAKKFGVPVLGICGTLALEKSDCLEMGLSDVTAVKTPGMSTEYAMTHASELVAQRVAGMLSAR